MKKQFTICYEGEIMGLKALVPIKENRFDSEEKAMISVIKLLESEPNRGFYILPTYTKE